MKILTVNTKQRSEFIDITSKVEALVTNSKINQGICIVFCPHTTAGLTINENADPSVKSDIVSHLADLVPENKGYEHIEGNSDSHIKSSLLGSSLNIIVENNQLGLGTWQGIYFCEFDGPRTRKIYIKIIKE